MTLSDAVYQLGRDHVRFLLGSFEGRLETAIKTAYESDDIRSLAAYRELRYHCKKLIEREVHHGGLR